MPKQGDVQELEIMSIIGFDGNAMKALKVHPDGDHIIYPFGTKIAIQNTFSKEHRYMEGHTNVISSITISRTGKYIASGQINHMGFKAPVIVWDYETGKSVFQHDSHKVRVENVQFSVCENYIISLGGRDDANVVVFDIHTGEAICGTFSSNLNAGDAVTIGALHGRNLCFLTGGVYTLKLWTLDPKNKSVQGVDVLMGKIRRKITCIEIMGSIRRLKNEYRIIKEGGFGQMLDIVRHRNIFRWKGKLLLYAPPFDGAIVKFEIKFHDRYPFIPPRIRIESDSYHPNVDANGDVCLPIIHPEHWRPGIDMVFVLSSFISLMNYPDIDHAFPSAASVDFKNNKQKFFYWANKKMKVNNFVNDWKFKGAAAEELKKGSNILMFYTQNLRYYTYAGNLYLDMYRGFLQSGDMCMMYPTPGVEGKISEDEIVVEETVEEEVKSEESSKSSTSY